MYDILMKISDPVGIAGVVLILIAYLLLSMGRWSAHGLLYQFLNFIGAWMILFSLYFHWNSASVLIEIAWIIISMFGMYRIIWPSKSPKKSRYS